MFRKYIFFILFSLISIASTHSQNIPGYLGKRAFVDYNFNVPYPLYLGPKFNNFIHNINFNYVIRRRATAGLNVDAFSLLSNSEGSGLSYKDVESTVKGVAIGVNFDWYNKKSIAPVGSYFRVSAKYFIANYEDIIDGAFTNGPYTESEDFNKFGLAFGYGIRRIFFDKMVFNVGGAITWVIGSGFDEIGYDYTLGRTYSVRMHVGVGVLLF